MWLSQDIIDLLKVDLNKIEKLESFSVHQEGHLVKISHKDGLFTEESDMDELRKFREILYSV